MCIRDSFRKSQKDFLWDLLPFCKNKFLILKLLLKAADNLTKNDQKCWSQPGFEPGAFQREKKVRNFRLKLYHCATEADTLTLLFYENQSICTYSLLNKSRT